MRKVEEAVDVKEIIKAMQGDFGGDNASQMKGLQLLKGLATSDDPKANEFMKKLNTATTSISKEVLKESKKKQSIIIDGKGQKFFFNEEKDLILEEGKAYILFEKGLITKNGWYYDPSDQAMSWVQTISKDYQDLVRGDIMLYVSYDKGVYQSGYETEEGDFEYFNSDDPNDIKRTFYKKFGINADLDIEDFKYFSD